MSQSVASHLIDDRHVFRRQAGDALGVHVGNRLAPFVDRPFTGQSIPGSVRIPNRTRTHGAGIAGHWDPRADDVEQLAEAIETLLGEPARAERLGTEARKQIAERFPPERQIDSFVELITTRTGLLESDPRNDMPARAG